MAMNVHHLELFYYVAKFEGITEAVRKMPYGIQQPAVSGQILQLERDLGVKLFQRRPFALTPAGEELYDFVYPFFSRLDQVGRRLRGEESQHLRVAAASPILTGHLPLVFNELKAQSPDLRLTLKDVANTETERLLQRQEVDISISLVHEKTAPGIRCEPLIEVALQLVVPADSRWKSFAAIKKAAEFGEIKEPLIALAPNEPIPQLFQSGLQQEGLRWVPRMEVDTLDLIDSYVRNGFGIGLRVENPGVPAPDGLRAIRLPGFPRLRIGLLYAGSLKPLAERFAETARAYAARIQKPPRSGRTKKR